VYLTSAHFKSNLQDGLGLGRDCPDEPERFDFGAYLEFLVAHGHNFIRLWRWEQFDGYLPGADVHFCMTPQPAAPPVPARPPTASRGSTSRSSIRPTSSGSANALRPPARPGSTPR
jgi:hypothetical protein